LKSLGWSVEVTGPYQAGGIFVLRDWGKANFDPLVRYLQALIEGMRWAMNPQNKDEVVAMLAERLRLPPEVTSESFAIAAHAERGFTRDARFEMEGFRNVLKLRAEILRTPGTDPNNPQKYLDLSYYEKALAGLP
jgi:ABC-type nitrate/sulfonate/bicarbonate transport system substrate-binding protein